jgi:hypothetical protein
VHLERQRPGLELHGGERVGSHVRQLGVRSASRKATQIDESANGEPHAAPSRWENRRSSERRNLLDIEACAGSPGSVGSIARVTPRIFRRSPADPS